MSIVIDHVVRYLKTCRKCGTTLTDYDRGVYDGLEIAVAYLEQRKPSFIASIKPDFKVGDEVRLKSGGPRMTIEFIDEESLSCSCVWFLYTKTIEHTQLPLSSLRNLSEEDN